VGAVTAALDTIGSWASLPQAPGAVGHAGRPDCGGVGRADGSEDDVGAATVLPCGAECGQLRTAVSTPSATAATASAAIQSRRGRRGP
jgi:hypothetical protein